MFFTLLMNHLRYLGLNLLGQYCPSARSLPASPSLPITLNPTHHPPRLSPEVVQNRESGHYFP
jgi:hypothetical protein